jgi:hypothetical protein
MPGTEEHSEHERDSSKVNVWYSLTLDRVIRPFFFDEDILDMLENHVLPQLNNNNHNVTDLLKALLGNGSVNTSNMQQ